MVRTVNSDDATRIRPAGVGLAMALLIVGAAIGYAGRISTRVEPEVPDQVRLAVKRPEPVAIQETPPAPESADDHALTLSKEQWSRVLANPSAFSIRIQDLRAITGTERSRIATSHGELFAWDPATLEKVDLTVRKLADALWQLESELAEVSFPEANRIVVSYDTLAGEIGKVIDEFLGDLAEVIGEPNAQRFAAVADLDGIKAERAPGLVEQISVQTDPDWGFITLTIEDGNTHETRSRILEIKNAVEQAKLVTSPAIDWETFLQQLRAKDPASE
jgi:hypothetical protein